MDYLSKGINFIQPPFSLRPISNYLKRQTTMDTIRIRDNGYTTQQTTTKKEEIGNNMTEKRWPKENPASRSNVTVINMSTGCNRIANKSDTNSEPNTFHPLLHLEKCCAHSEANGFVGICGNVDWKVLPPICPQYLAPVIPTLPLYPQAYDVILHNHSATKPDTPYRSLCMWSTNELVYFLLCPHNAV